MDRYPFSSQVQYPESGGIGAWMSTAAWLCACTAWAAVGSTFPVPVLSVTVVVAGLAGVGGVVEVVCVGAVVGVVEVVSAVGVGGVFEVVGLGVRVVRAAVAAGVVSDNGVGQASGVVGGVAAFAAAASSPPPIARPGRLLGAGPLPLSVQS